MPDCLCLNFLKPFFFFPPFHKSLSFQQKNNKQKKHFPQKKNQTNPKPKNSHNPKILVLPFSNEKANYEEFFIKYADYLEGKNLIEAAQQVFKRATNVFFKRRPPIHLLYSLFSEQHKLEEVSSLFENLFQNERNCFHLESVLAHINFTRRTGDLEKVKQLYEHYLHLFSSFPSTSLLKVLPGKLSALSNNKSSEEQTEGNSSLKFSSSPKANEVENVSKKPREEVTFLVIHYARFLLHYCDSSPQARKVYHQFLPNSSSLSLWLSYLSFEVETSKSSGLNLPFSFLAFYHS